MKKLTLLLLSMLFYTFVFTQNVNLYGNAPEYKNKKIIFYTFLDPITKEIQKLDSCKVNDNGDFNLNFNINSTKQVFTNIGIYQASLFVEPNKKYNIVFPPLVEKQLKDSLNPYFQLFKINIGIVNPDKNDLNILIQKFNNQLNPYLNLNFYQIYRLRDKSDIDSMINVLDTTYEKYTNQYFKDYVNYKLAYLKFFSYKRDYKYITHYYYANKPIKYYNVAYLDLFDNMYKNIFTDIGHSPNGSYIYSNVNLSKSSNIIKNSLSKEILIDDNNLLEFITLKGLNDAIYDKDFKNKYILQSLDTIISQTKIEENKAIAQNIKHKILSKKPQQKIKSYDFSLCNKDSVFVSLKDFRGKYVYLNFMYSDAYSCMSDYKILEKFQEKYKNDLEIVTIFIDTDLKKLNKFLEANKLSWTFLCLGDNKKLISDYKVVVYPTYILIDPYGKIIANPSRNPQEYFERYFVTKVLKSRK